MENAPSNMGYIWQGCLLFDYFFYFNYFGLCFLHQISYLLSFCLGETKGCLKERHIFL